MQGERGNHVDWLAMAGLSVRSELGGVTTPGQCYITSWPGTHAEARQQDTRTDRSQRLPWTLSSSLACEPERG